MPGADRQQAIEARAARFARAAGGVLPPWLVLLLSLFITLIVWRLVIVQDQERAKLRFNYEVQQAVQLIKERINLHGSVLRGARGHLAGSAFITESDWQRYLHDINVGHSYAGLEAVGLAMRVTAENKAFYLEAMRELGRAEYEIRPPGERPFYFPVTYYDAAAAPDPAAIGFDMWSDPPRRAAMRRAAREGDLAATSRVRLLRDGVEQLYGFSVYLPVYAGGGVPATVDQREARLVAFVFSSYTMEQFFDGLFVPGRVDLLTLQVYDGIKPQPEMLLYDSSLSYDPAPLDHRARLEHVETIEIGGAPWTLRFEESDAFVERVRSYRAIVVWLIGVPMSLILFFLMRALAASRASAQLAATRAAERMRASQAQFTAAADNAYDAIVSADQAGNIIYFNPAAERLYGYSAEEVKGKSLMMLGSPETREENTARYARAMRGEAQERKESVYEATAVRKDGSRVPVDITTALWRTEEGGFLTIVARDATARRRTEDAMRQINEELDRRVKERTAELQRTLEEYERADQFRRSVMENAVVGLVTLDRNGLITSANKVFCRIVGYTEDELKQKHWSTLTSVSEANRLMPEVKRIVQEEHTVVNEESELNCKDGRQVSVAFGANPIIVRGEVVGSVAAVMDITERKGAEAHLRTFNAELERRVAERTVELKAANEEMESFTYSVSHDLRAPLRHIDGHVQMLIEECGDDLAPSIRLRLERIAAAALHMAQLIDDLLRFSRMGKSALRPTEVDMNALVSRVRHNLPDDGHAPRTEWQIGELPTVECDETLMEQVWTNLLSNALKYSSTRDVAVIAVAAQRRDNEWVFSVRDNGVGFDMRYADKLYKVFERLHARDFPGTGIGLATVQRIVMRHGGRCWAEGKPDEGATFYFSLPTAD